MLTYVSTILIICGVMITGTTKPDDVCKPLVRYEKDDFLNDVEVSETPTITFVGRGVECPVICEQTTGCLFVRHAENNCSIYTSFVTPLTPEQSLPGAVYYIKDSSRPCGGVTGYVFLSPSFCLKYSARSDRRNLASSKQACTAAGHRLLVLDSAVKMRNALKYVRGLGSFAYHPSSDSYLVWVEDPQAAEGTCLCLYFGSLSQRSCTNDLRYICEIAIAS